MVPEIGAVTTLSEPYNRLYKVDLPTLGWPTIEILIFFKLTAFLILVVVFFFYFLI